MINCCMIVLNYNDSKTTINLLDKIKEYKIVDNIIVVDNCSSDDSMTKLVQYSEKVKKIEVIKTNQNGGYAYGNNYGCKYAIEKYSPEYFLIANPDVYFKEEVVAKLISVYKKNDNAAIVSCMMKCMSDIDLPIAWKLPRYRDCLLENLIILKKIIGDKTRYQVNELNDKVQKVEVIPGSFFMISKEAFVKVKGFDESTFLYYEENIIAYKLRQKGFSNYIITSESFDHMHSVSINKSISSVGKRLDLCQESRRIYCEKYLKCGRIKMLLEELTYKVGKFNYLLLKTIRNGR